MKTVSKSAAQKMLEQKRIDSQLFHKRYTILMPKEAAQNWLEALRSGEYIQSEQMLHDPKTGGFCCLGVEQYCNNDGYVENSYTKHGINGNFLGYPTIGYQQERGYLFVDDTNYMTGNPQLRKGRTANLNDTTIYVKKIKVNQHATKVVKKHKNDFATMADYLEECMLVY